MLIYVLSLLIFSIQLKCRSYAIFSIEGLKFNAIDNTIDRRSHMGDYKLDDKEDCEGRPL